MVLNKTTGKIKEILDNWGYNSKVLALTEIFWSLPMSWIYFYRPIFLRNLGFTNIEISLVFSTLSFYNVILPFFGSILANKLGKKKAFMLCDSFGWTLALINWIISKSFIHVMIAISFEGFVWTTASVWETLLVEDTKPEFRTSVYSFVSLMYTIGSLTTPIAGMVIGMFGIDFGNRILLSVALFSLVTMFILRWTLLHEDKEHLNNERENKVHSNFKEYEKAIQTILYSKPLLIILVTSVLGSFYYIATSDYLPLFLIDEKGLNLTASLASIIPLFSSLVTLLLLLFYVPNLRNKEQHLLALTLGYISSVVSYLVLVVFARSSLVTALLFSVLNGFYSSVSFSVVRTFLNNEIDEVGSYTRISILSIVAISTNVANVFTPMLLGFLYSLNPKYPFILVVAAMLINLFLMKSLKK
ncbi:MAG: MFS transporter [Thermoproteota archaeon]|nr:MFS transporter [Candidatus Brockarchaeota archaeon]